MAKLILSPSQQPANQYAGGGTGTSDSEQAWMEKLAARVKVLWDEQRTGISAVVVRKGSASANVTESNRLGATEHVALHTNAGGGRGAEIWHYPGSTNGAKLAKSLYPHISAATKSSDRGVKSSSAYAELRSTRAPAVIIEYLFHDNTAEAQEMRSGIDKFAVATVKGLCAYYGKTYKAPAPAPAPTPAPAPAPAPAPTPTPVPDAEVVKLKAEMAALKKQLDITNSQLSAAKGQLAWVESVLSAVKSALG